MYRAKLKFGVFMPASSKAGNKKVADSGWYDNFFPGHKLKICSLKGGVFGKRKDTVDVFAFTYPATVLHYVIVREKLIWDR